MPITIVVVNWPKTAINYFRCAGIFEMNCPMISVNMKILESIWTAGYAVTCSDIESIASRFVIILKKLHAFWFQSQDLNFDWRRMRFVRIPRALDKPSFADKALKC